jgi:hypothetical protein
MDKAFRIIESRELAAKLGVASDFRTFILAVQRLPQVRTLLRHLRKRSGAEQVLRRIIQLAGAETDYRYTSPWDTALTIYLWTLNLRRHDLGVAASLIIASRRGLRWSGSLARRIMSEVDFKTEAGINEPVVPIGQQAKVIELETSDSGEAVVLGIVDILGLIRPLRTLYTHSVILASKSQASGSRTGFVPIYEKQSRYRNDASQSNPVLA